MVVSFFWFYLSNQNQQDKKLEYKYLNKGRTFAGWEREHVKRNSLEFCFKFSERMPLAEENRPSVSDQKLKEGDGKIAIDF